MSINNRKWTTFTAVISLACLCVSLPACSASTKQDATAGISSQEESGSSEKAESQEETGGSASADNAEEKSESFLSKAQNLLGAEGQSEKTTNGSELLQDKVLQMGETEPLCYPTKDDPERIGIEYTVNAAKLYNTPEEAELDKAEVLTEGDLLYDIETEAPVSPLDTSKLSFLLCDVSIKNVNLDLGELNITDLQVAGLKPDGKELRSTGLPAYFSEAADEMGGPKYYHLDIPAGQSVDAKIGWWIDLEQYKKENLYVTYNLGGVIYIQRFWKLDL